MKYHLEIKPGAGSMQYLPDERSEEKGGKPLDEFIKELNIQ
jgi:hypothetical protein